MKIQTSDLTDEALDWAVATCEPSVLELYYEYNVPQYLDGAPEHQMAWEPSTNWSQGGEIIEREMISLICNDGTWEASCVIEDKDTRELCSFESLGETPLIAAMRCYVASKLGDEVDVPENLNA